ncbi:MAG: hypothetical protein WAV54_10400 [Acidimicrobiales bacterium]
MDADEQPGRSSRTAAEVLGQPDPGATRLPRWSTRCSTPAPQSDRFEERWGIEDPRITRVGGEYFVVYVGYSAADPLVCLAITRDFVQRERSGALQPPEVKDAALFPTRFGGRWALIHRPAPAMPGFGAHVWLLVSPDLRHNLTSTRPVAGYGAH